MNDFYKRVDIIGTGFDGWSSELKEEMKKPSSRIGSEIIFENDHITVWNIELQPGERLPFHHHPKPYFWTVHTEGYGIAHYSDGSTKKVHYLPHDTSMPVMKRHENFSHDIKNSGQTVLKFTTVEFKKEIL